MEHILTRDFKFSRDFKSIWWLGTLWYNCLRALCAGIVFTILAAMVGGMKDGIGGALMLPFFWPVVYLVFALPVGLFCAFLSQFIPIVGFITMAMSLLWVVIGDPIVWVIKLLAPRAVPVESTSFVNFSLIMWVLKPEGVTEIVHTEQRERYSEPPALQPQEQQATFTPNTNKLNKL